MNILKLFKKKGEVIPNAREGRYARVQISKEGKQTTYPIGSKYAMRGIPRGDFLIDTLGPIKRKIADIVNDMGSINLIVSVIMGSAWKLVYGEVPEHRLSEPIKELARVFDLRIEYEKTEKDKTEVKRIKRFGVSFLEEDFAYRYRWQWAIEKIDTKRFMSNPVGEMSRVFDLIIEAEDEKKGVRKKMRRFKRFACHLLKNPVWCERLQWILSRIDKSKTNLTKGDKYFFRAKRFNVDS